MHIYILNPVLSPSLCFYTSVRVLYPVSEPPLWASPYYSSMGFLCKRYYCCSPPIFQGTLYPYRKCNHVNILGLFTCHEKEAKFFHVHAKIEVFTFHGKIKIIFTDKYFNILLPILTVIDTRNVALQGSLFGMKSQHCL